MTARTGDRSPQVDRSEIFFFRQTFRRCAVSSPMTSPFAVRRGKTVGITEALVALSATGHALGPRLPAGWNTSPVGEYPRGGTSTTLAASRRRAIPGASDLRTLRWELESVPFSAPIGRAVMSCPKRRGLGPGHGRVRQPMRESASNYRPAAHRRPFTACRGALVRDPQPLHITRTAMIPIDLSSASSRASA